MKINQYIPKGLNKISHRIKTKILHNSFQKKTKYNHYVPSFSQEGEDMVLRKEFKHQKQGFYVDIGAHHPQRFSNTYYFYLQGWRGINIDAMPGSMKNFKQQRPRDINLEFAITECRQKLKFYIFNEPALNTFSPELANQRNGINGHKIIDEVELDTYPLEMILDQYFPDPETTIDFMNVDVESFDYQVLKTNNWQKYRPKLVLAEQTGQSLQNLEASPIGQLMKQEGYRLYSFIRKVAIYKDEQ